MSEIINATPHPIRIVHEDGTLMREFPPSGIVIRLTASTEQCGEIDGVPISRTVYSYPVGLPDPKSGTYYIVSQLVKNALPNRTDLLVPAQVVYDADRKVIGCQSLGV